MSAGDCWLWSGGLNNSGYGTVRYKGKKIMAHRACWLLFKGPIPDGLSVLHTCDNKTCINPNHLFLGTQYDNMLDMTTKGRRYSLLTAEDVVEIRELLKRGRSMPTIAIDYGVSISAINHIKQGRTWK